nr:Fic family protein [Chryseobacterium antibioticum]
MKYDISGDESEILPNKLELKKPHDIAMSEFEGFLQAEISFTENLRDNTKFDTKYILKIHKLALSHLYTFAGKYRNVNLSKGGFLLSSAKFLPESMKSFEDEILLKLPSDYSDRESLIEMLLLYMMSCYLYIRLEKVMAEQRVYLPISWLEKQGLVLWNLKK